MNLAEPLSRLRDVMADAVLVTFGAALLASAVNTAAGGGYELLESLAWYSVSTGLVAGAVAVAASTVRVLAFDVDGGGET